MVYVSVHYQYPSEPRKSASMRLPAERDSNKDVEHQHHSKSGNLYGETVRFSANCSSNANKNTHIKSLTSILE